MSTMDKLKYLALVIFLSNISSLHAHELELFDICSPENDVCLELSSCPQVLNAMRTGYKPLVCSDDGGEPVVCCVKNIQDKPAKTEKSISEQMCERYTEELCPNNNLHIMGGRPALPKELPFMAYVRGYDSITRKGYGCSGSLISRNFVLSAAHCSSDGAIPEMILLGRLDYNSMLEDSKPQQFGIANVYNHPDYKSTKLYNDIALYQLDRDARLNDYVRPICLNQSPNLNRNSVVVAAGWGETSKGRREDTKLRKVNLNLLKCSNRFAFWHRLLPKGIDYKSMICAGSSEGGKDTCKGDSGGPLFYHPRKDLRAGKCFSYTQIGITSFGPETCGLKGGNGVYTNVNYYLPWIESIVWPLNQTDTSIFT